jgi:hypothetical protein
MHGAAIMRLKYYSTTVISIPRRESSKEERWLTLILLLGTVITSFPNSWDHKQPHGLKNKLDEEIKKNKHRDPIRSIDDLVHLIIKLCVDFLRRDGPGDIKFQEAFQSSINNIVSKLLQIL